MPPPVSAFPPWFIGQKIRCIDDTFPNSALEQARVFPIAGEVYTIRGMQTGIPPIIPGPFLGFLLAEVRNPLTADGKEPGFWHTRFVAV